MSSSLYALDVTETFVSINVESSTLSPDAQPFLSKLVMDKSNKRNENMNKQHQELIEEE